ncbi:Peptidase inhibitor I78 family protein [Pigmentiphaga humi]|uniref:Peptidase inhibitor I78 family protein n=1 Tax=Pigmentiphaga humi TaxID=2478468 RepID=A0A3P4AXA7_9BURK|nr:I78 family peptidase inhibitor [Pigmentiphaga humi]VCU68161.1 Peptidase inhibitor I78 family protein [Pigmentiphaga humi]
MKHGIAMAIVSAALAAGCNTVPAPAPAADTPAPVAGACSAQPAQVLVGQKLTSVLAEEARQLSGAKAARVMRPGQAATMEFNSQRVNVTVNRADTVTAIHCG